MFEADTLPISQIAAQFESLGGGSLHANGWAFGCEFGFFQRAVGVEPLGLLRWASINPVPLIEGLRSGFEGIDQEDALEMRCHTGPEWGITQRSYRIYMDHTGLIRAETPEAIARRRLARALGRLRDKLLDELALGEKIFIYRTIMHHISDEMLVQIAKAIGLYGRGVFVYVRDDGEPFTAERVAENLIIARIDRFVPGDAKLIWNNEGWEKVCRAVYRIVESCR